MNHVRELNDKGQINLPFFRFLDTDGDGGGIKNAIGNYSGEGEEIFYLQPAGSEIMRVARIVMCIGDTKDMKAEEYGNLGSALSNGIQLRVQDDSGTIIDITDGEPIETNAGFGSHMFDVDVKTWGASPTDELLVARFTFAKSGSPLRLEGSKNERLEIVLNDNLEGLLSHFFMAQGVYETLET